ADHCGGPGGGAEWAGVCFFRAGDGIRGLYVTGVQTCALPISRERGGGLAGDGGWDWLRRRELGEGERGHGRLLGLVADPAALDEIGRASCRERVENEGGGDGVEKDKLDGVAEDDIVVAGEWGG